MSLPATVNGVPLRFFVLRCTLLLALLLGMLASVKLWLTARAFPLMPVSAWFPQLTQPWDVIVLVALLVALVVGVRFYRPAAVFFLVGALLLYCADQNRGQPWFYLYCVLMLLTLQTEGSAVAACRVVVSAVYVWAAIQKFGPDYQRLVVPYMMQPVTNWLPANLAAVAKTVLMAGPAVELFIGVGVWIPFLRRAAILTAAGVHGVALLILGPLGHNYNLVVWPWNLTMVLLVVVLFPPVKLGENLRALRGSLRASGLTALVTLLPVLSYFGRWDSYFSFALYSGNTATADLFMVPSMVQRLPEPLRRFAHPLHEDVLKINPGLRGLSVFDMQSWSQAELGVPPIPEPRAYRVIGRALTPYATQPMDMQLVIQPRGGAVQVLRASDLR
jgi:hypothetical protein